MKGETESYSCGRLNFVTGETGCGKSYTVKEWLKKKNDSRRVVIVGILGEYEEFAWRSDVVLFNHMDSDMENFVINSQTVKEADIIIFDGTPPSSLIKVILHLLNRFDCEIVVVCTEPPDSINLPLHMEWTKEESFIELIRAWKHTLSMPLKDTLAEEYPLKHTLSMPLNDTLAEEYAPKAYYWLKSMPLKHTIG